MKLSEFDFDLPRDLIAVRPVHPRSASRLLVATPDQLSDRRFSELPQILRPGDRLVLNDTRVIPARLAGQRTRTSGQGETSARIEVTLLAPTPDGCGWQAMCKPLKKIRDGEVIEFAHGLRATVAEKTPELATLRFNKSGPEFERLLARAGSMPLPPYIERLRKADERDKTDYQTIWARRSGAVAAPTASLHFDAGVMSALAECGIDTTHITLHVGAGTFLPVKSDRIEDHKMHAEAGQISARAADEINRTRQDGGRIVAVGTTALRLIETAALADGTMTEWRGQTDIFITPGYRFRVTDALITNFHLPRSTLLMLVSAFLGSERIGEVYRHAVAHRYRFFSYGDASLLLPGGA